jgi:membrane fusion protein, multidrug efflux system
MNAPAKTKAKAPMSVRDTPFLLVVLTIVVAISGCKKAPPAAPPPPTVAVMKVTSTNAPMSTEIIGQLDSPQNVEVRARVESFVDKILFTEGTEVKKGDQLFLLDKKPFLERLAAAKGMLAQSKAALAKHEADVARLTPLAKKRAVPQQDLDNANAAVDAAKAEVDSAQARVETAQLDLGYCDIRAPVTGLIGAKQVSIGELVGKGQPTLLATISTLDPIWFYSSISEVQYLKAQNELRRTGKQLDQVPVTLILADGSRHPDPGKIVFMDRAVDPKTGTLRIRAEFPNKEKRLRPGMFGRLEVDLGNRNNSIIVPEAALNELQGKNFVWVVGPENKAEQRPVTVGDTVGDGVLIKEGLKPGDRIVVEGAQKLREGAAVQVASAGKPVEEAAGKQGEPKAEKK